MRILFLSLVCLFSKMEMQLSRTIEEQQGNLHHVFTATLDASVALGALEADRIEEE